jgi:hypothetical protein
MSLPAAKQAMHEIVASYERMADHAERTAHRKEAALPTSSATGRPAT